MTQVTVEPQQGYVNTLVTVTGQGWFAGEPVFVFLRSQGDGDGPRYAYAAAVADERGRLSTAFTFPNEMRWIEAEWADVVAQGTRSGFEATSRFTLAPPTPTNTLLPPTVPPTAAATEPPLPTDTATPMPMPTAVVISDWLGEYFANRTLAGEPVLMRNDVTVDFYWGTDPPGEGVPADGFSVRWTRSQYFAESDYHFWVAADDGVRFWIDGQLLVDDWQNGPLRPHLFDLYLPEGEHTLHVEYYENLGEAGMQLGWEPIEPPPETLTPTHTVEPSATPTLTPEPADTPTVMPEATDTPVPTATPEPTDTPVPTLTPVRPLLDSWHAEYYANASLAGEPVLVREDAELSFDWGTGSPGEGVPADSFSAHWTQEVWVPTGIYRFHLEVDDGARLWIDGQLVINAWRRAIGRTYMEEAYLADGVHTLTVEYFESEENAMIHLWAER